MPEITVMSDFEAYRPDTHMFAIYLEGLPAEEARARMNATLERLKKAGWRINDMRGSPQEETSHD